MESCFSNPNIINENKLIRINHLSYNQDHSQFSVASNIGIQIYQMTPTKEQPTLNSSSSSLYLAILSYSGAEIGEISRTALFYRYQVCAFIAVKSNQIYSNNKVIIWDNQSHKEISTKHFKSGIRHLKLINNIIILKMDDEINVFNLNLNDLSYITKFKTSFDSPFDCFYNESLLISYFDGGDLKIFFMDKYFNNYFYPGYSTGYVSSGVFFSNFIDFDDKTDRSNKSELFCVDAMGRYFYCYSIEGNNKTKEIEKEINNKGLEISFFSTIYSSIAISKQKKLNKHFELKKTFYRGNSEAKIMDIKEVEVDKQRLVICFSSNYTLHLFCFSEQNGFLSQLTLFDYVSSYAKIKLFNEEDTMDIDLRANGVILIPYLSFDVDFKINDKNDKYDSELKLQIYENELNEIKDLKEKEKEVYLSGLSRKNDNTGSVTEIITSDEKHEKFDKVVYQKPNLGILSYTGELIWLKVNSDDYSSSTLTNSTTSKSTAKNSWTTINTKLTPTTSQITSNTNFSFNFNTSNFNPIIYRIKFLKDKYTSSSNKGISQSIKIEDDFLILNNTLNPKKKDKQDDWNFI